MLFVNNCGVSKNDANLSLVDRQYSHRNNYAVVDLYLAMYRCLAVYFAAIILSIYLININITSVVASATTNNTSAFTGAVSIERTGHDL